MRRSGWRSRDPHCRRPGRPAVQSRESAMSSRGLSLRSPAAAPRSEPVFTPAGEIARQDRGAGTFAQPHEEAQIVQRQEPEHQRLRGRDEVTQVRPAVVAARVAVAGRVQRPLVEAQPRALYVDLPLTFYPRRSIPPVARGRDTVEEVDTPPDCLYQAAWVASATP